VNRDEFFLKAPYSRFKEFIAPGVDRFALLLSLLTELTLPYEVLEIAGKRHIAVSPEGNFRTWQAEAKNMRGELIFTAHYDRTANSPGANDNGAAVFQLVQTAMNLFEQDTKNKTSSLQKKRDPGYPLKRDPLFIFTDGEELSGDETLLDQGSYSLGLYLKENGMGDARIFTFDACGTGDSLIISTAADTLLKNETGSGAEGRRQKVRQLRSFALEAARTARLEKVLLLPTPFSEDAGFLRSGLAAQTVTVLPREEAAAYASLARCKEETAAAVRLSSAALSPADRQRIPETWRCLNGPGDKALRLTPEHWKQVINFAEALAGI
jgi:hypothetical protein